MGKVWGVMDYRTSASNATRLGSGLAQVYKAVHKNNSVSGRPAGWLKKVRLETFFFIFAKKKKKIPKMNNIFMKTILATRCTGNRFFFYGQPNITFSCRNSYAHIYPIIVQRTNQKLGSVVKSLKIAEMTLNSNINLTECLIRDATLDRQKK